MKTFFQILILLILIGAGVVMYGLYVGGAENPINVELRTNFLKSTLTKSVLALNDPGDNRYLYLSPKTDSLTIEVDVQAGLVPHAALKLWLESLIRQTADKQIDYKMEYDINIPSAATDFTYTQLLSLAKKTRDPLLSAQNNYLHLLYLKRSQNEPTNAGMVLTATDIFIFKDVINELNERDSIRARIEQSTIKHEWGHLLGIEHIASDNCIMSPKVEVYENKQYQNDNLPLEYCEESLFQINRVKREAASL